MTALDQLAVLAAGLGAGILTTTVGVASLLSFPVLVAVGIPPVVANASNTVGLAPGAVSGSWGYRDQLREHPGVTIAVLVDVRGRRGRRARGCCCRCHPGVFEAVVPWLILFTCLLVGAAAADLAPGSRARHGDDVPPDRTAMSPVTTAFATATGVYGGYFGAGSGVMMMAVLGLGLDLEFRVVNALKTLAVMAANVVAGVIFILVAELDWRAIALLAGGSIVGGYVGSRIGQRLPAPALRAGIVVAGVVAAVAML